MCLEPAPLRASPGNPSGANQHQRNPDYDKGSSGSGGFYGDDPEYLTARIARDRPDILEKMQQGLSENPQG
jgi:hypothetical protein